MYKPVFLNILYYFHSNICIGFPVKRYVLIKNVCKNFSPKFETILIIITDYHLFLIRSVLGICF